MKLPSNPVSYSNPDMAISFKEAVISHVYSNRNPKSNVHSMELSNIVLAGAIYRYGGDC